ncbi:hypothetical protein KR018_003875, partial [Drosophila ironensis]
TKKKIKMNFAGVVSNILLIVACCYTMFAITPADHPYAYIAAAFSFVHGLLGALRAFSDDAEDCGRAFMISATILEVLPLPMANIEFYLSSDQSSVALVHSLSLIPLLYDMLSKMGDDWDNATETLKDMALIGNIASTGYLATKGGNAIHGGVAATAFFSRYGASLIDNFVCGAGPHVTTIGNAGILGLMTYALTH